MESVAGRDEGLVILTFEVGVRLFGRVRVKRCELVRRLTVGFGDRVAGLGGGSLGVDVAVGLGRRRCRLGAGAAEERERRARGWLARGRAVGGLPGAGFRGGAIL